MSPPQSGLLMLLLTIFQHSALVGLTHRRLGTPYQLNRSKKEPLLSTAHSHTRTEEVNWRITMRTYVFPTASKKSRLLFFALCSFGFFGRGITRQPRLTWNLLSSPVWSPTCYHLVLVSKILGRSWSHYTWSPSALFFTLHLMQQLNYR